ncbi:uncharacterized protein PRCAT00003014001 [Priceomyces carsonii]|uniref:uncharacterized protein n=1 Tax=Priceomyces carsonii TaxID=28549 RepID=UPI002EDAE983|nr:unnamed protein product [Priceomyces carsonii]
MIGISQLLNHTDEVSDEKRDLLLLIPRSGSSSLLSSAPSSDASSVIDKPSLGRQRSSSATKFAINEPLVERTSTRSTCSSLGTSRTSALLFPFEGSKYVSSTALPRQRIKKKFLVEKKLVKLAIRRKLVAKKNTEHHLNLKLHLRSLEAGLKVKLTLAPSMSALYNSLTPHTNQKKIESLFESDYMSFSHDLGDSYHPSNHLVSKGVQLIDNNLVKLSDFSNKVLQNFSLNKKSPEEYDAKAANPTFNSLKTAINSLFGAKQSTLIRVTRSTTDDLGGSVLLKLETARPGDYKLIDDEGFFDEMFCSIGSSGEDPNSLFVKKVLARPRYKSGMKLYLVPYDINCSLYTDERMLERDLINGVVSLESNDKAIYTTFPSSQILNDFKDLVQLNYNSNDNEDNERFTNSSAEQSNITDPIHVNERPKIQYPQTLAGTFNRPDLVSIAHSSSGSNTSSTSRPSLSLISSSSSSVFSGINNSSRIVLPNPSLQSNSPSAMLAEPFPIKNATQSAMKSPHLTSESTLPQEYI